VGVGDVDEFHLIFDYGFLWDIREEGVGVKMEGVSGLTKQTFETKEYGDMTIERKIS